MKFCLDAPLRIYSCSNHFDLTYFQIIKQISLYANLSVSVCVFFSYYDWIDLQIKCVCQLGCYIYHM